MRAFVSALVGVTVSIVAWAVLLPANLSEVDDQGRLTGHALDDEWASVLLVFLVVLAASYIAFYLRVGSAVALADGGFLLGLLLLGWNGFTAKTSGANLFIATFLVGVVPTAAMTLFIWRAVIHRLPLRRGPSES
jgi:lipopolysaccharide export LptBFGC system permease protein LptF